MTPALWALLGAALPFAVAAVALVKAWLRGREVARVRGLFGPRVTAVRTGYVVVDECGPIVTNKESP